MKAGPDTTQLLLVLLDVKDPGLIPSGHTELVRGRGNSVSSRVRGGTREAVEADQEWKLDGKPELPALGKGSEFKTHLGHMV